MMKCATPKLSSCHMNSCIDMSENKECQEVEGPWHGSLQELSALWEGLLGAMEGGRLPDLARAVLAFAYKWYNFMPLARGTAAAGYVAILGLFAAAGMPVSTPCPKVLSARLSMCEPAMQREVHGLRMCTSIRHTRHARQSLWVKLLSPARRCSGVQHTRAVAVAKTGLPRMINSMCCRRCFCYGACFIPFIVVAVLETVQGFVWVW